MPQLIVSRGGRHLAFDNPASLSPFVAKVAAHFRKRPPKAPKQQLAFLKRAGFAVHFNPGQSMPAEDQGELAQLIAGGMSKSRAYRILQYKRVAKMRGDTWAPGYRPKLTPAESVEVLRRMREGATPQHAFDSVVFRTPAPPARRSPPRGTPGVRDYLAEMPQGHTSEGESLFLKHWIPQVIGNHFYQFNFWGLDAESVGNDIKNYFWTDLYAFPELMLDPRGDGFNPWAYKVIVNLVKRAIGEARRRGSVEQRESEVREIQEHREAKAQGEREAPEEGMIEDMEPLQEMQELPEHEEPA